MPAHRAFDQDDSALLVCGCVVKRAAGTVGKLALASSGLIHATSLNARFVMDLWALDSVHHRKHGESL
jgi:hypothetical protein